ncbi:hypothetical protein TRIUR3_27738 [Triticum urartu]|uniref:Uncharacterized protein n=1 Tax=Triticum urartu TaxID=4572 RepID=M8A6L9_TRIUA|nr:hypothetical protein TRIUR3_27738 [Triticum urartu]
MAKPKQRQTHPPGMNKVKSHGGKHTGSAGGGGISRMLRQHKARLYIIRRCVVMLLCYHD